MWVKNRLGSYEWKPTKGGGLKVPRNPRSGWYPHPKNPEKTVWYESKTNTFHDKIGGPVKKALSMAWEITGGGFVRRSKDLAKDALKVGKLAYQYDKKQRDIKRKLLNESLSETSKLLGTLLVNKTNPEFVDVKDKSKIPPKQKTHEQRLRETNEWAIRNRTNGHETKKEAQLANNNVKQEVKEIINNTEKGSEINNEAQSQLNVLKDTGEKIKEGTPVLIVEEKNKKTPSKDVNVPKIDAELDFKRRRNMFQLTEAERKKIIMSSLEQEMYW